MLRNLVILPLLAVFLVSSSNAFAADRDTELNWKRHWRNYARRCVQVGNKFYTCALYQPQYHNSRGMTIQMVREKTTTEIKEKVASNLTIRRHLSRPNEDIRYITDVLPAMAVGQYGWIHSGEVKIIGHATGMILDDVYIIDTDAYRKEQRAEEDRLEKGLAGRDVEQVMEWRFEYRDRAYNAQRSRGWRRPVKLLGFSTIGLQKDKRWTGKASPRPTDKPGVEIAIVDEEIPEGKPSRKRPPMLVAVPLELFKRGITDEKLFLELLKAKGFTKEKFVELVIAERRANPRDLRLADTRIFAALDGRLEGFNKDGFGETPRTGR